MSVLGAVTAELNDLGPTAVESVSGQRALNLAAILDDRDGIQAGGVASTDKRLGELMTELRERFGKPKEKTQLELLRGGATG